MALVLRSGHGREICGSCQQKNSEDGVTKDEMEWQ